MIGNKALSFIQHVIVFFEPYILSHGWLKIKRYHSEGQRRKEGRDGIRKVVAGDNRYLQIIYRHWKTQHHTIKTEKHTYAAIEKPWNSWKYKKYTIHIIYRYIYNESKNAFTNPLWSEHRTIIWQLQSIGQPIFRGAFFRHRLVKLEIVTVPWHISIYIYIGHIMYMYHVSICIYAHIICMYIYIYIHIC